MHCEGLSFENTNNKIYQTFMQKLNNKQKTSLLGQYLIISDASFWCSAATIFNNNRIFFCLKEKYKVLKL